LDTDYKSYVGPRELYDIMGASQFSLLVKWGLRENHTLLDYGCGSLRAGKLFIPYLLPGKYYGFEPNKWLIEEGTSQELGGDILEIKDTTFFINGKDIKNKIFNYVLLHSIFSHANEDLVREILDRVYKLSDRNTQIFLTFIPGNSDYQGKEWSYPEGIKYTHGKMMQLFREHGFKYDFLMWKHPGNQKWVRLCKKV
jgi:hypothetical protein